MEDFVGAKFYCPHALADDNQHIWSREKTLEFFSTVSTLSLYLKFTLQKPAIKTVVRNRLHHENQ